MQVVSIEEKSKVFYSPEWSKSGSFVLFDQAEACSVFGHPVYNTAFKSISTYTPPTPLYSSTWISDDSYALASKHYPIKLLKNSSCFASIKAYKSGDTITAPHSLHSSYNLLYAGFKNSLDIFNLHSLQLISSFPYNGIISSISSSNNCIYSASFNNFFSIFHNDSEVFRGVCPEGYGITDITVVDHKLYLSTRKSDYICVYDQRNLSSPVHKIPRKSSTSRRINCHVQNGLVCYGSDDGDVVVCDDVKYEEISRLKVGPGASVKFHPFMEYYGEYWIAVAWGLWDHDDAGGYGVISLKKDSV